MSRWLWLGWALVSVPSAWAFCGFYVAQEPNRLFNQSSQVVLLRDGDRTVMTMANDIHGDAREFGLVVPVPTVIEQGMVTVGDAAAIDRLDQYSVPRLARYVDRDPCAPPAPRKITLQMGQAELAAGVDALDTARVRRPCGLGTGRAHPTTGHASDVGWYRLATNGDVMTRSSAL